MAGSPQYLQILKHLPREPGSHNTVVEAWHHLTENGPTETALYSLAVAALNEAFDLGEVKTWSGFIERQAALHIAKNAGYAGAANPDPWANFRLSVHFGIPAFNGVLVRMSDKFSRYISLKADASNDRIGESIIDTLIDLGAYALIALCIAREETAT